MNMTNDNTLALRSDRRASRWLRGLLMACFAGLLSFASIQPVSAQDDDDAPQAQETSLVDLNTATEAELVSLPGIGPSKARAIIERRDNRPFRRVAEIMRVRGIGRATFRALRDRLTVSQP